MDLDSVPIDIEERETCNENLMSNFDGNINKQVEQELVDNPLKTAEYPGWEFWGLCWYQDNKFYCMTMRYRNRDNLFKADTTEELMEKVCQVYGYA